MALTQSYKGEGPGIFTIFLDGLVRGFSQISTTHERVREMERLQAMSDEALAAKGLHRDEIPRHVFQDMFWQ